MSYVKINPYSSATASVVSELGFQAKEWTSQLLLHKLK